MTIRGLETASPSIEFGEKDENKESNGTCSFSFSTAGGRWKESVGSLLFVHAAERQQQQQAEAVPPAPRPPPGSYLCHTERILSFRE